MTQRIPQFQPQDADALAPEMLGQLNRAFVKASSSSSTRDRVRRQSEVFKVDESREHRDARHWSSSEQEQAVR